MESNALAGGRVVAVVVAVLTFSLCRPTWAQSLSSSTQRMSAVAASAKRALGPRMRYLSSGWQNAIGVNERLERLKSLGAPIDLSGLASPTAPSAPVPVSRFSAVSGPPDLVTAGTRYSGFTTNETSTAWCNNNVVVGFKALCPPSAIPTPCCSATRLPRATARRIFSSHRSGRIARHSIHCSACASPARMGCRSRTRPTAE